MFYKLTCRYPLWVFFIVFFTLLACVGMAFASVGTTNDSPISMEDVLVTQVRFYGAIIVVLISVIQGLTSYIYLSGNRALKQLIESEIKAVQTEINGLGGRVGTTERDISNLYGQCTLIQTTFLTKTDHDRLCNK